MMEPVFECDFTLTVRKSASRIRTLSKGYTVFMLMLGIGSFAYFLHAAVWSMILEDFQIFWVQIMLVAMIILLFCVFMPEIQGYFATRRFKKDVGDYHIRFGDSIEISHGNIYVRWEYSELTQAVRLPYHYELLKSKRLGIMLDPDSFTKGTFDEFKQFLREKRPDLNIPE